MATKQKKPTSKKGKASDSKSRGKAATTRKKLVRTQAPAPKPEEAINSAKFRRVQSKAEEYAQNPEKTKKLLDDAVKKAQGKSKGPLSEVWRDITALIRMVRAYFKGAYREVPWQTIVLAIAALIYFVSPIDLIPDIFWFWAGLLDDAAVISFVVASIRSDLDNFLEWEDDQKLQEDVAGSQ